MKSILSFSLCLLAFLLFTPNAFAVKSSLPAKTVEKASIERNVSVKKENLTRKEKREMRREIKTNIKSAVKAAKATSDVDLLLLVIIAILLPPLAMALYDGISNRFWISLLLTLLFFVPGIIYTLYIILSEN